MAGNKEEKNRTDPVLNHFQSMLDSRDYRQLAAAIQNSVNQAVTVSKKGIKAGQYQIQKNIKAIRTQTPAFGKSKPVDKKVLAPVAKTPAGTFSGPFLAVSSGLFLLFAIVFGVNILFSGLASIFSAGFCIFAGLGGLTAFKAKSLMGRVSRFKQYLKTIDLTHPSVRLASLSESTGKKMRYLQSDLSKMIELKMFPEGHLTTDGEVLLLTHDAYRHYQEELRQEAAKKAEYERIANLEKLHPELKEVYAAVREGEAIIREINGILPGIHREEVRMKVSKIISITQDIFEDVKQYPEHLPDIRRFVQYYLPMTLKIVDAYREFGTRSVQGESLQETLSEIETSLDTIVSAYCSLYDQLCRSRTLDISSDLSVMKTMLSRDGLTENQHTERSSHDVI